MWSNILDRISFWSLFCTITLLPLFFIPFTRVSIEASKTLLLVVGLSVAIIFWAMARFSDGKITIPKSPLLLAGLLVVVVTLVSALMSSSSQASLFGMMMDLGTFWFILAAFLLMFFSSIILSNGVQARIVLLGLVGSAAITVIFQIVHVSFPELLSLGVLPNKINNLVGSWNAFGIFSGLLTLVSVFFLEFFTLSKIGKWLLGILMVISLFLVAMVGFPFVWKILGIFALVIFVYKISLSNKTVEGDAVGGAPGISFPGFAFAVVMVALLFFVSASSVSQYLPAKLGVVSSEIGPSFGATMEVTGQVLKKSPVLGTGPNTFSNAWALYRPVSINNTPFWNVSFNAGSGLLPTFAATTGYLGILAWMLFLLLFVVAGARSVFSGVQQQGLNSETMVFFTLALYILICSVFYFIGPVLFLLGMAMAGIFVGLSAAAKPNGQLSVEFLNDHRKSFFFILSVMVMVIAVAAGTFKYVGRFTSIPHFEKALRSTSEGKLPEAQSSIQKAVSIYNNDLYLRTYAQIHLVKLATFAQKTTALTEAEKGEVQTAYLSAVENASRAVAWNKDNYLNHMALGGVYGTATALGVTTDYEKAVAAYTAAATLNPGNPGIKLALARVSFINRKFKEAKTYATEALALKTNYIDALVILSRVALTEGSRTQALTYAKQALALAPTNEALIQYVKALEVGGAPEVPEPIDTGGEN